MADHQHSVRMTTWLSAELPTAEGAARSVELVARHGGRVLTRATGLLCAGDRVRLGAVELRVLAAGAATVRALQQGSAPTGAEVHVELQAHGRRTQMRTDARWAAGSLSWRDQLATWQDAVGMEVVRLRASDEVVAGAVIDDGRVLMARRAWPADIEGLWELPGGGVDPGESAPEALVRELDEELGIAVAPGGRLGADVPLGDGRVLRAHTAVLVAGTPQLREHTALRWVGAAELATLDLVPADQAWLSELTTVLR